MNHTGFSAGDSSALSDLRSHAPIFAGFHHLTTKVGSLPKVLLMMPKEYGSGAYDDAPLLPSSPLTPGVNRAIGLCALPRLASAIAAKGATIHSMEGWRYEMWVVLNSSSPA